MNLLAEVHARRATWRPAADTPAVLVTLPFVLAALLLTLLCNAGCISPGTAGADTDTIASDHSFTRENDKDLANAWNEVERLENEQKFEAASDAVAAILAKARAVGDEEAWTRALIEEVLLRTGLHGYETAVRFLEDEPWPADPLYRAVLDLHFAHSLVVYAKQYGYEIRNREAVAGDEIADLKAWTLDQIATQASLAFQRVWSTRQTWGGRSLGTLAHYIEQNNYPARIRGSLRDAVSYLWVELLADTSFWRPEQSNELFLLDMPALIQGNPSTGDDLDLADPAVHPLRRLCAVLDDLERWHREQDHPEAALETRLVRLQRLHGALSDAEDRLAIRRHLETMLEKFDSSYSWWAMGQWQLAAILKEESDPDSRIRAHRAATAGRERHPDSAGGKRCDNLIFSLEVPHYRLAAMASDGANQRSIQITHQNLERLHFRAWRFPLSEEVQSGKGTYPWLLGRKLTGWIQDRQPDLAWSVDLPATEDYRSHQTYASVPATSPGAYIVMASVRADFQDRHNRLAVVEIIVSDLVLVACRLGNAWEISARSGATGQPLADVEVELYRRDGREESRKIRSRRTDENGLALFESLKESTPYFAFARNGNDLALSDRQYFSRQREIRPEHTRTFIYTDRSVFRPGQKVHWHAVVYRGGGDEPSYHTLPHQELVITLEDGNRREVAADTVSTNDFGSVSGQFTVPDGRLLGRWHLVSSVGGNAAIRVEEYKRPTFEVTIPDPDTPLRLNRPAVLTGEVEYYFGLPVVSGEVVWRITREPVFPRWWWWRPPSSRNQTVAAGRTELNEDGQFTIEFIPRADERLQEDEGVTYNYRLSVDVTDEGGETRSARRDFRLGFVSVAASITAPANFQRAGRACQLIVARTNLDGVARPGVGSWWLVALQQPEQAVLPADQPVVFAPGEINPYRTVGDSLQPRWQSRVHNSAVLARWPDGRRITCGKLHHDPDGKAEIELTGLAAGAYRLHYETEDDFGALCRTRHDFLVAGSKKTPAALALVLQAEKSSVPVGDTARLLVRAGLPDQEMVLEFFQDGRRLECQVLHSGLDDELIEIPVTSRLRGGIAVRLTAVRDHQLMQLEESLFVPWDDRKLQVEFETFRDRLRPGSTEIFRVKVRGSGEQESNRLVIAGATELLAYMYDRSLDVFATHRPPRPLSLYPRRSNSSRIRCNLWKTSNFWHGGDGFGAPPPFVRLHADGLRYLAGYGIGGLGRRMRSGQMFVRGGRSGDVSMRMDDIPEVIDGIPVTESIDVEGAKYMVEVKSAVTQHLRAPEQPLGISKPVEAAPDPIPPRTDFSETAFFAPHLLLDEDGTATIEFKVPDSVTDWQIWVHALTRDLRSGSAQRQAASVKELMVRPYLPRFLREGDRADLKVVVNNAGQHTMSGRLDFELFDPDTDEDLRAAFGLTAAATTGVPFTVEAGGGIDLSFPIVTPARVGSVAIRVTARAGDFSDGEQRPVPVLPGRLHLMQSRFVSLHGEDRREMYFADLAAADDPTLIKEQMVVTVDAQLFYSVLSALPYLVEYPYECTEQLLNRFLSTGIVTSLFDQYPPIEAMAQKFAKRQTRLEQWSSPDPNRKLLLEESPWLVTAEGGGGEPDILINVLDPRIARSQREGSLAKLEKAQAASGGFPWWPGGRPSPYLTLYILHGFAKGLEFGVDVPKDLIVRAWLFMHRHYYDELVDEMLSAKCCWETITFLNYTLSSFPDKSWIGGVFSSEDRQRMLNFSFRHWREHSPLLKGYLALTLARDHREQDAHLVFDSVMDSAKSDVDLGTYWAPEDRAWLWYNDTIETHAFALRVMMELAPDDERRHGLVQWLLLNKKLNHWRSTRATAEVIYSLVHYLEREGALGVREVATVTVGPIFRRFVFEPDEYTGAHNRVIIPGSELDPATMSTVVVEKETRGTAFASATWHFSTEKLPDAASGDLFTVTRSYFRRVHDGQKWVLARLPEGEHLAIGDQVEVQLAVSAKHAAEFVHLRDPRGAGFEPESMASGYRWNLGLGYYEEIRDSGTNFFFDWLPAGQYTLKYRLRANMAGEFRVGPAVLQPMYAPEFVAYSAGKLVGVE